MRKEAYEGPGLLSAPSTAAAGRGGPLPQLGWDNTCICVFSCGPGDTLGGAGRRQHRCSVSTLQAHGGPATHGKELHKQELG